MTKEEILAMEAGEKLDRLVAETLGDSFQHEYLGTLYHHFKDEDVSYGWSMPAPVSTNISAAWQVVGRMFELGYAMSLLHLSSKVYPQYWYCDFRPKDSNKPPGYEWVDRQKTAPEVISKAALLTKLAGEDKDHY